MKTIKIKKSEKPETGHVTAVKIRKRVFLGRFDILAYTRHGSTSLISVATDEILKSGDVIKTQVRVLGAKQFIIVGQHTKPMKLPGSWYEVEMVKEEHTPKKQSKELPKRPTAVGTKAAKKRQ